MKIITVAAVAAGGKTSTVNALAQRLPKAKVLYFDDYTFEGEVEDFYQWVVDGADYNVWNLEPLEKDILKAKNSGKYEYLVLDYPFAYKNDRIKPYIECAVFIDTPLDIALARRILRDMKNAGGDEIRTELDFYVNRARSAFIQMQKDILPSSDFILDGEGQTEEIVSRIMEIVTES